MNRRLGSVPPGTADLEGSPPIGSDLKDGTDPPSVPSDHRDRGVVAKRPSVRSSVGKWKKAPAASPAPDEPAASPAPDELLTLGTSFLTAGPDGDQQPPEA